jgi:hypothetical protein
MKRLRTIGSLFGLLPRGAKRVAGGITAVVGAVGIVTNQTWGQETFNLGVGLMALGEVDARLNGSVHPKNPKP